MDREQPQYTADVHALWKRLFERQRRLITHLACPEFSQGLAYLDLSAHAIPRFDVLSERLCERSGWTIHAVDGLLPAADFFARLAERRFPVTWWLRAPEQADYIVEPDLFHDLIGHLPLLADPFVGDFMRAYGEAVHDLDQEGDAPAVLALTRLYWFTVEFGLVGRGQPQVYGAGLLSSFQESQWSLQEPRVERCEADLNSMMRQDYVIDRPQARYFVLPSLEWLWQWDPRSLKDAARAASQQSTLPVVALPD